MNQAVNDKGVCRTALATPGLLNILPVVCVVPGPVLLERQEISITETL